MILRNLEFGQDVDGVLKQFERELPGRFVSGLENDESLDQLVPVGVGHADDGGFRHRVVLDQGALHLEGADAEIARI